MPDDAVLVLAKQHAGAKEENAPCLAPAAVGYGELGPAIDVPCSEAYGSEAYSCDRTVGREFAGGVQHFVKQEEDDAGNEQSPEEPEGPGYEFIVSAHGGDDEHEPLCSVFESVGVGDAAGPVAEAFVEYAEIMPDIVEQQEQDAPFEEGNVESPQPFADEHGGLAEVFPVKEISGSHEKQRHVESVDEVGEQLRSFGVAHHHKYNSNSLENGDSGVALHGEKIMRMQR